MEATEYNCNTGRGRGIIKFDFNFMCLDIWSAGCIFIELFVGETLFRANDGPNLLQLIYRTVGMPSKDDLLGMKVNLDQFVPANERLVIWPMQGIREVSLYFQLIYILIMYHSEIEDYWLPRCEHPNGFIHCNSSIQP